jgi:hypothetical protein
VKDRDAGARFVELASKAFSGEKPTPRKQPYVPVPLSIKTAVLGHNMDRTERGAFSGQGGGWTATKWFPAHDDRSAEVYFNYNLARREGEISEKEPEYADDLVAVFTSALRDGPRPERTPENDPNLTRTGPAIGHPRKLLSRLASHESFSPKARFAVYQDGATVFAVALDPPEQKPFEVVRFEHSPWDVHVLDEDLTLLVQEGIPEQPGVKSSGDPMRIWWVSGKGKEKELLRGPEKDINLAEAPVSPDRRYVGVHQWRDNPGGNGRIRRLHILDREHAKATTFELPGKDLTLVGWRKVGNGFRGVVVTNRWQFEKKKASELYLADPATGKIERQENVDARLDLDNPLSPDGKHRIRAGKNELVVTDVDDGKEHLFVLHEDDRRYVGAECIEWVSPRYVKFNGPRLALIDVTTMKMCFPVLADGAKFGSNSYKFSSDFRWVLYQGEGTDGEGLFLAPVELPREP